MEQPVSSMPTPATPAVESINKKSVNLKMFLVGFGVTVLVALVASGSIGCYRAYAKGATDGFTVAVAKVLHLSALKVNGEKISYSDYADDMRAIHKMNEANIAENAEEAQSLTEEEMSDQVLWRFVNNILLNKIAIEKNIKVEDSEVKALKDSVVQNFKSEDEFAQELQKRYGWDLATYEKKVMRSYVLQNKLAENYSTDQEMKIAVANRALAVLNELKAGGDFAALAVKNSEDTNTSANGGDLGWIAKEDLPTEFVVALKDLKNGELAPTPLSSESGYHVIKLEEKKVEKIKDDNGKMVNQENYHLRHIMFLNPSLQTVLDSKAKEAEIKLFIKIHNPFAELKK